jgi:GNAT superfamily N-acetyltransferase
MWSCTVSLFDGVLRGAADLRIVRPLDLHEAEAAFSIEKPWQSHGVGSALFERTQLVARNRGIKHMQVCCPMENQGCSIWLANLKLRLPSISGR